jgi:hypothetical protein
MIADELREIQNKRYSLNPEYFNDCVRYINRDLREFAKEHRETTLQYPILRGEFILYRQDSNYLPGDTGICKVSIDMFDALSEYYHKEGVTVTWAYDRSQKNGSIAFTW